MLTGYKTTLPTDCLLNAGVLFYGKNGVGTGVVIGVTDGAPDFDPGVELGEVMFDNRAPSRLKGLTRRVGFAPVFKGTLKEFGPVASGNQIAVLEPGVVESISGSVTTETPKPAGALFVAGDYIVDFRWIFERAGGGYAAFYAPLAIVRKWSMKGNDKKEAAISFEIEAIGDPVNDLSTAPYTVELRTTLPQSGIPLTIDTAVTQLNAAGADVLATFVASDLADGSDINTLWSNHWRKAGLTDADIGQLQLIGGTGAAGECIKTLNSDGVAVVRYDVGWVRSTAAWNALDQTLGFSIYVIGTFKSTQSCLVAVQNAIDFATPTRRVALVSDLFTYNAQHPSIDYLSPSDRYQMRCGLDANMRSFGMSIATPRTGETNPRYNLQRSADVAVEDHKDFIQGPANHAQNAADVAAIAGANSLILGTSSGVWGGASNDDIAAIIICRAPQTAAHAFVVEQLAEDAFKAFKETAPRVAALGDSVHWQTFLPDALSGGNADYSTASPDFINADLAAALPAGWHGTNGAWGGETAQSGLNDRWTFLYPILLNARTRTKVVVSMNHGVNDFTGPPGIGPSGYSDPGGTASIYANRQSIIATVRALVNASRIKIDEWTIQPAWVDGATNPTAAQEVTRVALNSDVRTGPRTSDHLTDITTDSTIGQPGENTNATYYDNTDGWMVHMTPAGRAIRRTYVAAAVAALA